MSLYGLQRMPVTLHRSQWEREFKRGSEEVIGEFIDKHGEYLPTEKGQTVKPVPKSLIGEKGCPFPRRRKRPPSRSVQHANPALS